MNDLIFTPWVLLYLGNTLKGLVLKNDPFYNADLPKTLLFQFAKNFIISYTNMHGLGAPLHRCSRNFLHSRKWRTKWVLLGTLGF